jgi:hypothetical protein
MFGRPDTDLSTEDLRKYIDGPGLENAREWALENASLTEDEKQKITTMTSKQLLQLVKHKHQHPGHAQFIYQNAGAPAQQQVDGFLNMIRSGQTESDITDVIK